MKRNLAIILLTSIMLCCLSLFAACNTGVHTHTIEKVEAVAATCETAGNIEYYRCDSCDKLFSDESYTETTLEETVIAALGHDEESHDAKAATCTEDGWDAYVTCKRDGCDYTTKVVIPALDHDYDSEVTTQPTCTEKGVRTYTCKRTGCEHTYTEDVAIDPNAHDFESHDAKAATCTEDGYEAYKTCKRNGCDYTTYQKKDAIGHKNKVHHVKVNATCTEAGTIEYWSCPDCNKNYSDEACTKVVTELTIAALDHNMQPVAKKDATCTETGYDAYEQCSRCDHNTKGNDIPALDHDYDSEVTTQPTCTEKGVRTYTCKRTGCGHTYTEDVNALGHDNKGSIARKDATCTEAGVEGGTYCTRCNDGKAAAEKTINALGHAKKVHHVKVDATCTEAGTIEYWSCPDCNKNYSDEACTKVVTELTIAALDHDIKNHEAKAATCTEDGWDAYDTCKREGCNYTTYQKKDALGHDIESHDAKAATCTEDGWDAYVTCKREGCNYTTYKVIPALGYQARLEKTITSTKANKAIFLGNSYGTKTSGSVYGDGKVGGLSYNATLSYTFSLKTHGTVDFIWKIAANNYSAAGNRGVADLSKVADITIDGTVVHVEGIALTVNPSNEKDYWYSFDLAIENVALSKGEHVFALALSGPGLNVTNMTIASDATVLGVYQYQTVVDKDFVSSKSNAYAFTYDSNGTSTNGSKANGTGIGSLDNNTKYLNYTFNLAAADTIDFVWKVAGAKWNGNAGGTGVAGNLGVDDLSTVASITLDGQTVGADQISLKPDTYTNYWHLHTLVINAVSLDKGEHTLSVKILQAGINVQSMTIYSDKVVTGHETAKAIIDGSFTSTNKNTTTLIGGSDGVTTSGSVYGDGRIGGLTYNATLSYTFSLSEDSAVDLIWKIAGNNYNGNAGGTGVAGNLGVSDLGKVATITIDGKSVDVNGIALTTDTYTNYWYLHTVVIKNLKLSAGTHTFSIALSGPGLNVKSLDVCSNVTVAGIATA